MSLLLFLLLFLVEGKEKGGGGREKKAGVDMVRKTVAGIDSCKQTKQWYLGAEHY